ncbi:MAG: T9SS type A sorting domain-containing protein [bacterium]|nr:T9SS type A sorting domain-containing protein [Candidatus Limimorpha equi]
MKKLFTLLAVAMLAIVNANAQTISSPTGWVDTPENWEDYVVDIFIWGSGNSHLTPEDTIQIEKLDGDYEGYLPIIIECPGVAEVWDAYSGEIVGFSKYIRVNNIAQLAVYEANNRMIMYGIVTVLKAYTRPPQMVPFTDTLFVEEGKKEILKPWHWVPYEETFVQPGEWSENGEFIDGCFGMKRIEIYGPTAGDTTIYEVSLVDGRLGVSSEIFNTFVVIGTEKSQFGVDEAVTSPVNVYPNPSNDGIITIKGEGTAEIFNIIGQKVMDVEVMNETRVSLSSGLYIVRMGGHSEKVFVE